MTDKDILEQYGGIKAELRQIESELSRLRNTPYTSVVDCVQGSSLCPPYQPHAITIRGVAMEPGVEHEISRLEARYEKHRKNLYFWLNKAEDLLSTIPDATTRALLRYKCIDGLGWQETAAKMGSQYTVGGLKMQYKRFMEKF